MKYLKTYEFYKPIKINNQKPFKVKKNIDKSIRHLQKGIKAARQKLEDDKINDPTKMKQQLKRSKINKDKNDKIKKLGELTFKQIKQNQYLRDNPVKESYWVSDIYYNTNIGDEIICIKPPESNELTNGKKYVVINKKFDKENLTTFFIIINDLGIKKSYLCNRFITSLEYHQKKFNV